MQARRNSIANALELRLSSTNLSILWLAQFITVSTDVLTPTVISLIQGAPNPKTEMILVSSCSCLWPIHWIKVLSRGWRCNWSGAHRRCSNYIWVINNFIACGGVAYIRSLTVMIITMTSWHGNFFHITGPVWGESTGHLWILLPKDLQSFAVPFVISLNKLLNKTVEMSANRDAMWYQCIL